MPRTLVVSLVALTTALGLAACGGDDDGGNSGGSAAQGGTGVSTKPVELPASLGPFRDIIEASKARGAKGPSISNQTKHQAKVAQRTQAAYSKAYSGASAGYRQYADENLERLPWVIAVRSSSPGLVIGPVEDPAYLLLATPNHEVKDAGEVQCRIDYSPPTLQGKTPTPESQLTTMCQRSSNGLTVSTGGSGFEGPDGFQAMVDLTNNAYEAAK
jgi:hypothetical protein